MCKLFHNIFASAQASVGNYMVTESKENTFELFKNMFFMNYLVTCFTSVSLIVAINSFIEIWLGKRYIISLGIVAIFIFNNYARHILQTSSVFRNAAGIYNPYRFYKYWGLVEGAVNLISSLILIHILVGQKLLGIFLGTSISTVITSIVGPHALFKYYFGIEKIKTYIRDYWIYLLLTVGYSVISIALCNLLFVANVWLNMMIALGIALIIPNVSNAYLFRNSPAMLYFKNVLKRYIHKNLK